MKSIGKKPAVDRSKIDLSDPAEAKYWARKLAVDNKELGELIKKVGHSAAAVRKEIETRKSSAIRKQNKTWRILRRVTYVDRTAHRKPSFQLFTRPPKSKLGSGFSPKSLVVSERLTLQLPELIGATLDFLI
jgi:hypothetical protein